MKNKLIIILIALVILNISFSLFQYFRIGDNRSITYVRSNDLIYGYMGTKEVQNIYNEKQLLEQARIDSLENEYNKLVDKIEPVFKSLSDDEKKQKQMLLNKKEQEVYRFSQAIEEKMREEEGRLMQGVLNQINTFVKEYGELHNLEIILGSTNDGNILYGKSHLDITDEVLTELNNNYRSQ